MKIAGPKHFIKNHASVIQIGLLTATAIVLFQVINLFVVYRYLKLDYYLSLVAICFLTVGLLLNKRPHKIQPIPLTQDAQPELRPVYPVPAEPREDLLTLLTSKEILILRLLAEGKTNKEIAAAQFIELSTVKTHVNNIYTKLSVSNRKEARSRYAQMAHPLPVS
jgi:DNA-binding CsgD family transcriptional regulator